MNKERLIDIITRRQVLQGGLLASAAALLAGCQTPQRVSTNVPGPIWPDMEPGLGQPPLPPAIQPQQPSVTPQPRTAPGPIGGVIPRSRWTSATDSNAIARKLSNIRNGHINRRPEAFADIGYHYIIDPAGRVWEGRPLRYQGAHVEKRNEHNLGIMVMGNFEEQKPTTAQLSTLERFVIDQMRRYQVSAGNLFTHKELGGTLCPGKNLQRWMLAQRSPAGSFARI